MPNSFSKGEGMWDPKNVGWGARSDLWSSSSEQAPVLSHIFCSKLHTGSLVEMCNQTDRQVLLNKCFRYAKKAKKKTRVHEPELFPTVQMEEWVESFKTSKFWATWSRCPILCVYKQTTKLYTSLTYRVLAGHDKPAKYGAYCKVFVKDSCSLTAALIVTSFCTWLCKKVV